MPAAGALADRKRLRLRRPTPKPRIASARRASGIQSGFQAFAKGQVVELNFSAITNLQPSRSGTPQVELILSSWF